MGILEATRGGNCTPNWGVRPLPDKEVLEKTLKAVKRRRGLLHGAFGRKGGSVCALGALALMFGDMTIDHQLGEAIAALNDSMPRAKPATRRLKMIAWLEQRIAALP